MVFGPDPHLKTSGIAIALADVLEADGKHGEAYDVYLDALTRIQAAADSATKQNGLPGQDEELSGPEKLRAIALAYKLGELAGALNRPEDEEKHLVWAIETILPAIMVPPPDISDAERADQRADAQVMDDNPNTTVPSPREAEAIVVELALPEWATKTDLAAPFEALGTFYAQNGRLE